MPVEPKLKLAIGDMTVEADGVKDLERILELAEDLALHPRQGAAGPE